MNNCPYHILFIDDDKDFLNSLNIALSNRLIANSKFLELDRHLINDANEGLAFIQELKEEDEKIAVIVSDQMMPSMTGIELIEKANVIVPNAVKILLTGYASVESARYAINNKILDYYVAKPIEDHDSFATLIINAAKTFHFYEEKERAEKEIEQYVKELELKNERIRDMHSAAERIAYLSQGFKRLDLDDVLDLIIAKIPDIFNSRYASLFLLDEEKNALCMVRSNYLEESYTIPIDTDSRSPMMCAFREDRIIVLPEITQAPYDFLNKESLGKSLIIIPFSVGDASGSTDIINKCEVAKGVLNMGSITSMEDKDVVQYAASLIRNILGINILNARLYQKTQQLALFDNLTGLYNKFILNSLMERECSYSERSAAPLFLAMTDIDDFKEINDTHGHLVGDKVLAELGMLCKKAARMSDIIARFGGEEFALLISGGDERSIGGLFERIRVRVQDHEFPDSVRLTVSIGVARYNPGCGDSPEKLLARADKALYKAKAEGKNRVEFSYSDVIYEQ